MAEAKLGKQLGKPTPWGEVTAKLSATWAPCAMNEQKITTAYQIGFVGQTIFLFLRTNHHITVVPIVRRRRYLQNA